MSQLMRKIRWYSRWHVERRLLARRLRPVGGHAVTSVAGWQVPTLGMGPDAICYCAGVGENVDVELSLIGRWGVRVFAFDPTPRAIAYVKTLAVDPARFQFQPIGVWSEDVTLRFYAPDNPAWVSHSIVEDDRQGRNYFEAPCRRLSHIMKDLGHTHIDLLKMNIEGAEYEVLRGMMEDQIKPRSLCLTFEGGHALRDAQIWTRKLDDYGYDLAALSIWQVAFVRRG